VLVVICGLGFAVAAWLPVFAQFAKKRQATKGPRALGLLELAANGKAHLLPVTIMIDGKFYDAGAYKADPVPMALQPETVYEALKSGVSEGLFTVSGAMAESTGWIADGKWRSSADIKADAERRKAEAAKKAYKAPEEVGGPPKLHRAPQAGDQTASAPSSSSPPALSPSQTAPPAAQTPASQPNTASSDPSSPSAPKNTSSTSNTARSQASEDAPGRPTLRRQPLPESPHEQTKPGNEEEALKGPIQLVPAISDSDGAEPRPYKYEVKPEEEQKFLKTMTGMASDEVKVRATQLLGGSEPPAKPTKKAARPAVAPQMQDVQMHIFDLTNSNEPVLVLTATATIPNARIALRYMTTVVAREDIYGELHKVFVQTTDDQHLDVIPKYEFIDAVDAEGDGRGELLFRKTQDSGPAFGIYAVIGDRLWPLFEGKPGR